MSQPNTGHQVHAGRSSDPTAVCQQIRNLQSTASEEQDWLHLITSEPEGRPLRPERVLAQFKGADGAHGRPALPVGVRTQQLRTM